METTLITLKNIEKINLENAINKTIELIEKDYIVAVPTDTVYGIASNAFSFNAVEKIFNIKGREKNKGILCLIGKNYDLLNLVTSVPKSAIKLMNKFWPGALTLIFKSKNNLAQNVYGGLNTIGLRVPNNEFLLHVLNKLNLPLATSSANFSNMPAPINANDVYVNLQNLLPLIIDDGECKEKIASTIVDVTNENIKILREGAISKDEIFKVLNQK